VGKRHQGNPTLYHHTIFSQSPNDQASSDKPREWFWRGLERFANTDDSAEAYLALSKSWPTFWPITIEDQNHSSIAWNSDAHILFLHYRTILRSLWAREFPFVDSSRTARATSTNGSFVNQLFGTEAPEAQIKRAFGRSLKVATTSFWPEWGAGVVRFISYNDFQRAVWLLFQESWRAKLCSGCGIYFIASKPAQGYCSTICSNQAHRSGSLRWWKQKGAEARRTRRKKRFRK
jgi:hypothetical protein